MSEIRSVLGSSVSSVLPLRCVYPFEVQSLGPYDRSPFGRNAFSSVPFRAVVVLERISVSVLGFGSVTQFVAVPFTFVDPVQSSRNICEKADLNRCLEVNVIWRRV